jgi:hypothetical protein
VKIDTGDGAVTATSLPAFNGLFDVPLSLAFGTSPGDRTNVVTTNGDLPVSPGGPGPSLVRINVGVKGFAGK